MDAIEFFQAIEGGAEYRVQDIPRLIEDEYDRENAERMFADFVCASGKAHLLKPPPGGGTPLHDYNPDQPRDWRGRWTKVGFSGSGIMTYERYSNLAKLLRETDDNEDLRWAQKQLGEELISERYLEGTSKFNRTRELYSRTGGNPYNLEEEMAELRGKHGPDLPNADLRTKTETEIEAEWDQFNKAMETGDRSLAPPGGIERMNALMNEIERRQRAYEAARLENLGHMTDEELSEFVERERKRYVDDLQSMSQADRTLYRNARDLSERRSAERVRVMREEARLRVINEDLTHLQTLSISELTAKHRDANLEAMNAQQADGDADSPPTPHTIYLQEREVLIRNEIRTRRDIEGVGQASVRNLESWANNASDERLRTAATQELLKRRENVKSLKTAVQSDFENAKSLILQTAGGIPSEWPTRPSQLSEDDPDFDPYMTAVPRADEVFENMGLKPADAIKPFMAKHFYEDDERLLSTMHRLNINSDGDVEVNITLPGVQVSRTFKYDYDIDGLVVSHDFFKLDDDMQGSGISREVMQSSIKSYKKMGIDRIDVHANIDKGGYVWARYGFVPTYDSWRRLKYRFEEYAADDYEFDSFWRTLDHDDPKTIWQIADNRQFGKDLLMDSDWYGSVDFHDSEVVDRFENYAFKRD